MPLTAARDQAPAGQGCRRGEESQAAASPENKRIADARAPQDTQPRVVRTAARAAASGSGRCGAAGATVSLPGWYVVKKGDTLSEIAERHYGRWRTYRRIYAANRRVIRQPDWIYPCQRIYMPRLSRGSYTASGAA